MVAEDCQDTGHVYTSYSGYGDITIQSNDCDPPIATLITITDPWSNNHTDQIMSIGTIKTFTSGSEVYTVEMTDMFCGVETTWSDYTECWYTEDGNRYVKTTGSDSALGNNWANAWLTMGYGFQNIPSGKDLYVEEGLYGGETLSNLDPPQTMKMYIQPSGHTEAACNVWVNDKDSFSYGSTDLPVEGATNMRYNTVIQGGISAPFNGTLVAMDVNAYASGNLKLKIFRDDGTNFNFIGETDYQPFANGLNEFKLAGIDVQAGDLFGFKSNATVTQGINHDAFAAYTTYTLAGDITSNTLKSSWSTFAAQLLVKMYGFKAV